MDENDVVDDILENASRAHWPSIAAFLLPEALAAAPTHNIGDAWAWPSAPPVSKPEAMPAVAAPSSGAAATAAVPSANPDAPSARTAPLLSELLAMYVFETYQETDSRKAERDVKPYIQFAMYIMGDRAINAYGRDAVRELCLAFSRIPHREGI